MLSHLSVDPLTTDDTFWHRLTLAAAACYQLVQSVLKVGFALAKRWDGGGGWTCCAHGGCLGWLQNSLGRHCVDHFSLC